LNPGLQTLLQKIVNLLFTLGFPLLFLLALHNHFQLVTHPHPLEYTEPGMLTITGTFAAGDNPYALPAQPMLISTYTPLYNLLIAPLSHVFGNTLVLHRAVAAFFILASAALGFAIAFKVSRSYRESFAVASIFYAGLLFYHTPIASPNGLGVFLFLASLYIPWRYNFSSRSLCVALVLGILGFYTKQYFLAGVGYLALYLFLAESKLRGIIFAVCAALLFAASVALVQFTSPYFLADVLFSQKNYLYFLPFYARTYLLLLQLLAYCQLYLPVLAILCIQLFWLRRGRQQALKPQPPRSELRSGSLIDLNAPLCRAGIDYVWLCIVCSLLVTIFLARTGTNPTYPIHVLSPFLLAVIAGIIAAPASPKLRWLFQLLLLVAGAMQYAALHRDVSVDEQSWQRLRQELAGADDVFVTPSILPEVMDGAREIYQNGHTSYFAFAEQQPAFLNSSNPQETPAQLWIDYADRINTKIKTQAFDLIVLDLWTPLPRLEVPRSLADLQSRSPSDALLKQYYYLSEVLPLRLVISPADMDYSVQLWRPLPKPAAETPAP
jgi:hypothetical protein